MHVQEDTAAAAAGKFALAQPSKNNLGHPGQSFSVAVRVNDASSC
jgi:hypothetical protein